MNVKNGSANRSNRNPIAGGNAQNKFQGLCCVHEPNGQPVGLPTEWSKNVRLLQREWDTKDRMQKPFPLYWQPSAEVVACGRPIAEQADFIIFRFYLNPFFPSFRCLQIFLVTLTLDGLRMCAFVLAVVFAIFQYLHFSCTLTDQDDVRMNVPMKVEIYRVRTDYAHKPRAATHSQSFRATTHRADGNVINLWMITHFSIKR